MLKCLNVKMKRGFTLIEMMVAVTIFALVIGSATGLFISAIRSQAKVLATQKLLDESSYVMEYMSRALRMAKKELSDPPTCLTGVGYGYGYNYEINPSGDGIKFLRLIETIDVCQEFRLNSANGKLEEWRDGAIFGELTSNKLDITFLEFNLSGEAQPPIDNLQPRVTISMTIKKAGATGPEIKIQTTISQRNLDVQR